MPCFLSQNQKQHDVQEANNSRSVPILRRVVENVNARIKRFKWFDQVIPNSSIPSIEDLLAILASMLSCFHVPMVNSSSCANDIIVGINALRTESNNLQTYLIDN